MTGASQEYKLHLRTKELEINGRIFRFFFKHLYAQIFIWEFAHCCLCQVKITTEQENMKCWMWKKGHGITPT